VRNRLQLIGALLAALLIVSGLSACEPHVGAAAFVGKDRISEKTVNSYVTAKALPYEDTSTQSTVYPKSYVLNLEIEGLVFSSVLTQFGGTPTPAELASARTKLLANTTDAKVTALYTAHGYTASFEPLLVHAAVLSQIFNTRYSSNKAEAARVVAAIKTAGKTVRVSPRYGTWDASTLELTGGVVLPSFIKTAPTTAATN
jgi:hypothetical protein